MSVNFNCSQWTASAWVLGCLPCTAGYPLSPAAISNLHHSQLVVNCIHVYHSGNKFSIKLSLGAPTTYTPQQYIGKEVKYFVPYPPKCQNPSSSEEQWPTSVEHPRTTTTHYPHICISGFWTQSQLTHEHLTQISSSAASKPIQTSSYTTLVFFLVLFSFLCTLSSTTYDYSRQPNLSD